MSALPLAPIPSFNMERLCRPPPEAKVLSGDPHFSPALRQSSTGAFKRSFETGARMDSRGGQGAANCCR